MGLGIGWMLRFPSTLKVFNVFEGVKQYWPIIPAELPTGQRMLVRSNHGKGIIHYNVIG